MKEGRTCSTCCWVGTSCYNYPDECIHPLVARVGSTKFTRNCIFQRSLGFFKTLFTDDCGKRGRWWNKGCRK
jgi:hypothetical protein